MNRRNLSYIRPATSGGGGSFIGVNLLIIKLYDIIVSTLTTSHHTIPHNSSRDSINILLRNCSALLRFNKQQQWCNNHKKSWLCRPARNRIPFLSFILCPWDSRRCRCRSRSPSRSPEWEKERENHKNKQIENKFYANVAWLSCERSFNSKWFQATFYFNSTTN